MKRRATLLIAGLACLWAKAPLPPNLPVSAFAECHDQPGAVCLLDIGLADLLINPPDTQNHRWLVALARAGKLEQGASVAARIPEQAQGRPASSNSPKRTVSQLRLAQQLRAGATLDQALLDFPEADGGDLWIVGLELLGRDPYGQIGLERSAQPRQDDQLAVKDLAKQILDWARTESDRAAKYQVGYAAELFAHLGDRQGVLDALSIGGVNVGLPLAVWKLARADVVLAFADPGDTNNPHLLQRAGETERDNLIAADYFQKAFNVHANRRYTPNFSLMLRVVQATADRGLRETSRVMAARMAKLAEEHSDDSLSVFQWANAADALQSAGGDRADVSKLLARAMDKRIDDRSIAYTSLATGVQYWGSSGFADEARGMIAEISAEVGDVEVAQALLSQADDAASEWAGFADRDMPLPILERLSEIWNDQLSPEDSAYVSMRIAREIAGDNRQPELKQWALRTTRQVASSPDLLRARDGYIANATARVAHQLGDTELAQHALVARARMALDNMDGIALILTAHSIGYGDY